FGKQPRQLGRGPEVALPDLRQGRRTPSLLVGDVVRGIEETHGQAHDRTVRRLARTHYRNPPEIHGRDDTRCGEPRYEAGACQGRLAGPAGSDQEEERRAERRRLLPLVNRSSDVAGTSEEHRRVFDAESRKTAKRRSLEFDRPWHRASV